ncbi:hypothetical protein SAMN04488109_5171 [Chryseolinea serpens]|uniref:Uncharacterized protein n=1 Tax=Chryseolinea serpens TaxID=947013 RepID=A0A1M5VL44_9BACT|nr:hypothetical protein [Chryseolinea serpens]SHH75633.1 hypothetical protein SAMN04488109_5171 [Chryseolinea serpens]
MESFCIKAVCEWNERYSVVVEDDHRVCYAYLLQDDKIVGDVWLYNSIADPVSTDWKNREDMPFLNPIRYIKPGVKISPVTDTCEIEMVWKMQGQDVSDVDIYVRKDLLAKLKMSRPGWSTIVSEDGPLAKVLM